MSLEERALSIRRNILKTAYGAKAGHIGPSFSGVEILTSLYFDDVLKYDVTNPLNENRDKFVLSKGHGALLLYSVLCEAGYITSDYLKQYCDGENGLGMHPHVNKNIGIETTSGSLGHGVAIANGMALSAKILNNNSNVYVLVGDGECQEGSIWEALLFSAHNKLDNLTVIIDNNKIQGTNFTEKILHLDNMTDKLKAFGFSVFEVDGHDFKQLKNAFTEKSDKPKAIIANTVKGKGVSFMENNPAYHSKIPTGEFIEQAIKELGMTKEELEI